MGKKINFQACDDISMFQVFKQYVHQNERNEFYVDGTPALLEDQPGVIVDFRNIEYSYEIFDLLGNYWGGWNSTPSSKEMSNVTKHWEEKYDVEIFEISKDSIGFHINRELSDVEIDSLVGDIKSIYAEPNYIDGFDAMRKSIKEKKEFSIWWD